MLEVFKGYNHNYRIEEGEFFEMKNLTSTYYPLLSSRAKRGLYKANIVPVSMISKDELGYISNDVFYYGNKQTEKLNLNPMITPESSQFVSFGEKVIFFGKDSKGNTLDVIWIDTTDMSFDRAGAINYVTKSQPVIGIQNCLANGDILRFTYNNVYYSPGLNMYKIASSEGLFETIDSYVEIRSQDIGIGLKKGDILDISLGEGITLKDVFGMEGNITGIHKVIAAKQNSIIIDAVTSDDGQIDTSKVPESSDIIFKIEKLMPYMDYVVESNNRLWGCRYGLNRKGEFVNEIYASKLGDFSNWEVYEGLSTDSYSVTVGSDGAFTGAISYLGYPLFFKENCIHKIYGTMPSNYQVQTTECKGVEKGSNRSLAIVDGVLFYKSPQGICAYDGSMPTVISRAFGDVIYKNGIAGALGSKYYVSLENMSHGTPFYVRELLVFDTKYSVWHKEEDMLPMIFCSHKNNIYYVSEAFTNQIRTVLCEDESCEKEIRWSAETGVIGLSTPDGRYISKINLRVSLNVESRLNVFIKYNSSGDWLYVGKLVGSKLQTFNMPILPQRCDHFQLKFEGVGDFKLYSISKTIEQGGEE